MFKRIILSSFVLLFFVAVPTITQAQTVEDLQKLIASLKAQIEELQRQMDASSKPASCYNFGRYVAAGHANNKHEDVVALHKLLVKEGFLPAEFSNNDEYTDDTASAVVDFQQKYGIQRTGFVGPKTRAKLNSLCGTSVTLPPPIVPTKTYVDIDQTSLISSSVTPTITGFAYSVSQLDISISSQSGDKVWGSGNITVNNNRWSTTVNQTLATGTYKVIVYISNVQVASRQLTITAPTTSTTSKITVLSPNGGENLVEGSSHTIRWTGSNLPSNAKIIVDVFNGTSGTILNPNTQLAELPSTATSYTWTVKGNSGVPSGPGVTNPQWGVGLNKIEQKIASLFGVKYAYALSNNPYYVIGVRAFTDKEIAFDASDSYFTITSPTTSTQPTITVLSPNGRESLIAGNSFIVKWWDDQDAGDKAIYAINSATGSVETITPNIFLRSSGIDGTYSYTWQVRAGISVGEYKLKVCTLSKNQCDLSNSSFTITAPTTNSSLLKLNSPAVGENIQAGSNYTIRWNATPNLVTNYPYADLVLVGFTSSGCDPYGCGSVPSKNIFAKIWDSVEPIFFSRVIAQNSGIYKLTIATSVSLNQGSYTWAIPSNVTSLVNSSNGKYKIFFLRSQSNEIIYPYTDNVFSIITPITPATSTEPKITVLSPNGGETLVKGQTYQLKWLSQGILSSTVVNAFVGATGGFGNIGTATVGTGSLSFVLKDTGDVYFAPGQSKIVLYVGGSPIDAQGTPSLGTITKDYSDSYFTITEPAQPTVSLISGKDHFFKLPSDSMYLDGLNLRQTDGFVQGPNPSVSDKLLVTRPDNISTTYFYSNVAGYTGWYDSSYKLASNLPSEFLIIRKVGGNMAWMFPPGTIYYGSDTVANEKWYADFKARYGSSINVSSPTQPESTLLFQNAKKVPFTKVSLSAVGSAVSNFDIVATKTGSGDKNILSTVYLIDENGNKVGSNDIINSANQVNLNVPISIPAGATKTFTVVADVACNLSQYAGMQIGLSIESIRYSSGLVSGVLPIVGASHVATAQVLSQDPSTQPCSTTAPTITVLSPNGGESWTIGSTQTISWNAVGDVQRVKVDLVDANNINNTIVGNLKNSLSGTGSFSWTVPQIYIPSVGNVYKLKVSKCVATTYAVCGLDPSNIFDVSNNFFTITAPTTSTTLQQIGTALQGVQALIDQMKAQ